MKLPAGLPKFGRGRHQGLPDLRGHVFELDPAEVGMVPNDELPTVWGLVVDMPSAKGSASLVSLADGTTSLYTSLGGGVIGGGFYQRVAGATRRLLVILESRLRDMDEDDTTTVPPTGHIGLIALAYDGRRRTVASQDALASGSHPLSPIFFAAHDVITELRIATDTR